MLRRIEHLLGCCLLVLLVGTPSAALAVASSQTPGQTRVTGGQEAKECAFPSVVVVKSIPTGSSEEFLCSGTLIHPQVVLYAGHCGVASTVIFGEHWQSLKLKTFQKAMPHPEGNTGFGTPNTPKDWAFAVLEEPIEGTPIIPVAAGAELGALIRQNATIFHAGYSANNAKAPTKIVDHHLKWAQNQIAGLSAGSISTGAGSGGVTACPGDSGGPMLAKTKKGGWRVVGISSSKTGGCGASMTSNAYARVRPEMLAWVEKESGIDINPCFDTSGNATPSRACDKFMAYTGDPNSPVGTWDEGACKAAKTVSAKEATGIPDSGEPDPDEESPDEESPKEESPKEESPSEGTPVEPSDEPSEASEQDTPDQEPSSSQTPKQDPSDQAPNDAPEEGKAKESESGAASEPEEIEQMACRAHRSSPVGIYLSFALLCGLTLRRRTRKH